jgi:predicted dehydrogenase
MRAQWIQDGRMAAMAPDDPGETADAAFVRLIRGEGPNWSPPEEVWPVLRLTRAALQSAVERDEVVLPPSVPQD